MKTTTHVPGLSAQDLARIHELERKGLIVVVVAGPDGEPMIESHAPTGAFDPTDLASTMRALPEPARLDVQRYWEQGSFVPAVAPEHEPLPLRSRVRRKRGLVSLLFGRVPRV